MRSLVATSFELIDMSKAALELATGIKRQVLLKNSMGILYCDSELEDPAFLLDCLRKQLDIEIVGCTAIAVLNSQDGFCEMCNSLIVLTSDDCQFSMACSQPLADQYTGETDAIIRQTYQDGVSLLSGKPNFMIAFPPYQVNTMLDIYPKILSEVSGNIPVFGGVPASNAPYGIFAVLYQGRVYSDRMLLIMIKGNIDPIFSVGVELSMVAAEQRKVTSAKNNIIHTVDDMSFVEYLYSVGLSAEKLATDNTNLQFAANPLKLTSVNSNGDSYQLIRTLHTVDILSGDGIAVGMVPEGSTIAIGCLTRHDIAVATRKALSSLLEQIETREAAGSYRYTTILALSCVARYMVMTPDLNIEGNVLKELLPPRLNFFGFYGYGELCPTMVNEGIAHNTAQNEALVLCAF